MIKNISQKCRISLVGLSILFVSSAAEATQPSGGLKCSPGYFPNTVLIESKDNGLDVALGRPMDDMVADTIQQAASFHPTPEQLNEWRLAQGAVQAYNDREKRFYTSQAITSCIKTFLSQNKVRPQDNTIMSTQHRRQFAAH